MPSPLPSPDLDDNDRAFSPAELAVRARAYARQMMASLGVDGATLKPRTPPPAARGVSGTHRCPGLRLRPSPATGLCPRESRLASPGPFSIAPPRPGARGQHPPGAARQAHRGRRLLLQRGPCRLARAIISAIPAELVPARPAEVTACLSRPAWPSRRRELLSVEHARHPRRRRSARKPRRRVPALVTVARLGGCRWIENLHATAG